MYGAVECDKPELADVILINSCAITSKGERDARNAVFGLKDKAPNAKIILTGCGAELFNNFLPRKNARYKKPDSIIFQKDKSILLHGPFTEKIASNDNFPPFSISNFSRSRPIVKIQDGCDHRCTYCIVPITRGKSISRPINEILLEIDRLISNGYGEIILSGINLSHYGREFNIDFWDLISTINDYLINKTTKIRFRISSIEPSQLNDKAINIIKNSNILCPHIHISLQHTSQNILKLMGRGHYTIKDLESFLDKLQKTWPIMGLGADILVGFPNESDEDFSILINSIRQLPLTYAHVFPYSIRPNTKAKTFQNQIPKTIKLERAKAIREIINKKHENFLLNQIKLKEFNVVCDNNNNAVNEYYAPCIFEQDPLTNNLYDIKNVSPIKLAKDHILVKLNF